MRRRNKGRGRKRRRVLLVRDHGKESVIRNSLGRIFLEKFLSKFFFLNCIK
jgi:hypothetical protein